MPAPLEVFATGAIDVYLAPPNTADPVINVAVPGAWIKVGVAGASDYGEDGVKARKETENNEVYTLGQYGTRKVFRVREKLFIEFVLMDATLEAYRDAFNQTAVTTLAGPPAEKTIPLLEGIATPTTRALLLRSSNSPYMDGGVLQWWVPIVYQTGNPETVYRKSDPVGLSLQFTAISDATNGFGKIHAQTA
jgi:hypothetical protein